MIGGEHPTECEKPRLLVLASTYPRWAGDYEPGFVHELARRLTTHFRVRVLCPHARGAQVSEELDGVEVVRFRYAPSFSETLVNHGGMLQNLKKNPFKALLLPFFGLMQLLYTMVQLVRYKPDVIHAHWIIPQGACLNLARALTQSRAPFLITSHGADLFALTGWLFELIKSRVVKRASAITVVSQAMVKEVHDLGASETQVQVVPMGVDLNNVFVPPGCLKDKSELLFVGRLVEKKGVKYLIEAMVAVVASFPDVFLRIVGYGPEEVSLRRRVAELGLNSHVEFMGAVSHDRLPELYRRANLFVAPFVEAQGGDQEGFGLVLVEALGCGCRLIVSDMPATKDSLEGIDFVSIVPQKDVEALSAAISFELERGVEERFFDRARLVHRFGWDSIAESYSSILRDIQSA